MHFSERIPVVKRRISVYFNSCSCIFLIFAISPVYPISALGEYHILWSSSPYISLFSAVTSVLCARTSASSGKGNGLPITKHAGMKGGGGWFIALPFPNFQARLSGWSTPDFGRSSPRKGSRYPLYGRLGCPQGRSGLVCRRENFFPPTGVRNPITPIPHRFTTLLLYLTPSESLTLTESVSSFYLSEKQRLKVWVEYLCLGLE